MKEITQDEFIEILECKMGEYSKSHYGGSDPGYADGNVSGKLSAMEFVIDLLQNEYYIQDEQVRPR